MQGIHRPTQESGDSTHDNHDGDEFDPEGSVAISDVGDLNPYIRISDKTGQPL